MRFGLISRSLLAFAIAGALIGCAAPAPSATPTVPPASTASAASPTSPPAPTAASSPTAASPTTAPSPTARAAATSTAVPPTAAAAPVVPTPISATPIANQFELTAADSGKLLTYSITSRFSLVLDRTAYPPGELKVLCSPANALGAISNLPSVSPPSYAVRYEGVTPGACAIGDRGFLVEVQITAPEPAVSPTAAVAATPTAVGFNPSGLNNDGQPSYIDDRSTAASVIQSYYNAIDRKEYDRAYSYWQPGVPSTSLPPYDQFKAGYATTASVDVTLGPTTSDAGAGQLYFKVPTILVSHLTTGPTQTYVGCYTLHLAQPAIQDFPPFQPIQIVAATIQPVAAGANPTTLLGQACH